MPSSLRDILHFRNRAEDTAAALPALMMLSEKIANTLSHGEHTRKRAGLGHAFWQYREYTQTDRPQDIDWRRSAKGDDIFIRQREHQTTQKTFFWCASGRGMDFKSAGQTHTKRENAVILALTFALLLRRAEEDIGLLAEGQTGRAEHRVERIGLHGLQNTREEYLPSVSAPLPRHAGVIVIGDFLAPLAVIEPELQKLGGLAGRLILLQVLDPAERSLPYQGRVLFEGYSPDERILINNVPSIRESYAQRMNAHLDGLRLMARKNAWAYALHDGAAPLISCVQTILMHLRQEDGA